MGLTRSSGWRPRARLVSIGAGSAEIFLSLLAASFGPDFYRFRLHDRTDLWSVINAPPLKRRHPVVSLLATSVSRPATCRRRGPHRHSHKGASIKTALTSVGPIDSEETTGVWFRNRACVWTSAGSRLTGGLPSAPARGWSGRA